MRLWGAHRRRDWLTYTYMHTHIYTMYGSIYPLDTQDFDSLELAVNKLTLNDASVSVQVRSGFCLYACCYALGCYSWAWLCLPSRSAENRTHNPQCTHIHVHQTARRLHHLAGLGPALRLPGPFAHGGKSSICACINHQQLCVVWRTNTPYTQTPKPTGVQSAPPRRVWHRRAHHLPHRPVQGMCV